MRHTQNSSLGLSHSSKILARGMRITWSKSSRETEPVRGLQEVSNEAGPVFLSCSKTFNFEAVAVVGDRRPLVYTQKPCNCWVRDPRPAVFFSHLRAKHQHKVVVFASIQSIATARLLSLFKCKHEVGQGYRKTTPKMPYPVR